MILFTAARPGFYDRICIPANASLVLIYSKQRNLLKSCVEYVCLVAVIIERDIPCVQDSRLFAEGRESGKHGGTKALFFSQQKKGFGHSIASRFFFTGTDLWG